MSPSRLLGALCSHQVDFVVVGGHAVIFHGHLRTTEDLDVIIRRSDATDEQLLAALAEIGARWIGEEIDPETGLERTFPVDLAYVQSRHLMMLITQYGFLDVFDYIPGYLETPVDDLFETAEDAGGIRYAGLHWLRRMKQAAGRHKDLADLEALSESE